MAPCPSSAWRLAACQPPLLRPRDDDDNGSKREVSRCTLKFQAVSAAYRVLMDKGRRSHYNRTGKVLEDNNNDDGNNHDEEEHHPLEEQQRHHTSQDWENFFRSVFDEMVRPGVRHAKSAEEYRGLESK